MFKIGEFSKLTQVSIRMLRYYDETGLLKPAQTDSLTGYRLYSAGQIVQLRRILVLKDMGFTHPEVSVALLATDLELSQMFTHKQLEIKGDIQAQQERLKKIEQAEQDLLQGRMDIHQGVSIKSVPAMRVLSLRRVVADYYAEGMLWKELTAFATERRLPVSNETFSIYHDPDYREQEVDIEICTPVSCTGVNENGFVFRETQAVPLMASAMVYGPFENIAGAYASFAGWLQAHALYRMGNHSRQIVHRGPWNEANAEHYVTEIQIPLEKRAFSFRA